MSNIIRPEGNDFDLDKLKRRHEERLKKAEREEQEKKSGVMETDTIIVTKHGAFKKKPTVEISNDIAKPQIFKLELVDLTTASPKILVSSEDGKWKSEIPFTLNWNMLFNKGEGVKYVIATGDASGRLLIDHVIELQERFKF